MMKSRKILPFVLVTVILLCSIMTLPALAQVARVYIWGDEGEVFSVAASCCSNPDIEVYKKDHKVADTGNYCTCIIVQYCNNCGDVSESTATSTHGCTWWCSLPEW